MTIPDRTTPKDWGHTCGECNHYNHLGMGCDLYTDWDEPPDKREEIDPDLEACSDFEPKEPK